MFDGHHLHGKQAIETNKVTLPCFSKTNVHLTENVNIPQWNSTLEQIMSIAAGLINLSK